jgi:hypothetical protein
VDSLGPNHLDALRLTNHGNTVDTCLKVADMELQTPGDTAEFAILTSTDNEVWGSEVTLTTHEQIVKKTEVNSHKERALEFNVEPSLDHKSNWPRHQGPRAIIHWEKCGCYWCIPIKTPFKIPAQYKLISGLSFAVPLDEVWCKLGGCLVTLIPHCAYQVQYMRFTLPQCAQKRHITNMQLCRSGYTADKVLHTLKGHQPFKLLNCFIHYLVNLEIRMLCTLYAQFQGRRPIELVKSKIRIILSRVTSLVLYSAEL